MRHTSGRIYATMLLVGGIALGLGACGRTPTEQAKPATQVAAPATNNSQARTLDIVGAQVDPDHITFTLEGCNNDGSFSLPINGKFVCADARYTTGNLGKGWNELDLVPFRITVDAGNAAPSTQTYTFMAVLDNMDAGKPGYDVISEPVLNTSKSAASCIAANFSSQQTLTGFGGIDQSIYRKIQVTQAKNTVCVYDYYGRLALGSHLFPGSSLHANLANKDAGTQGIGSKDVSIPVKEILPQELSKDMSAVQGTDHIWNIKKDATPASMDFGNTCAPGAALSNNTVQIKVTFEKLPATATGPITVLTHVYAINPASRVITVNVTDKIYAGATPTGTELDTASSGPVDVAANTTQLVLTHSTTVPAGPTTLSDKATATYTDKVTGVAVPGQTEATASANVSQTGPELNANAVVNDVESMTGANLKFAVDSVTGASGAFNGGYTLGTQTVGPVSWTSISQSGSGYVNFGKTVYVTSPTSTTGSLSDTATLTGSDGFSVNSEAGISIQASATPTLKITKTIPNILQGSDTASFTFRVKDANNNEVASQTISFAAGETTKTVQVGAILQPGIYTVTEDPVAGWNSQPASQPVDLSANSAQTCVGTAAFTNTNVPATAKAVKVTLPAGAQQGWDMTLTGPGTPAGGEKVTTDANGNAVFSTVLQEGAYSIAETAKAGYVQTSAVGCTFTVNYPADNAKTFTCTITNALQATAKALKVTVPAGAEDGWEMTLNGPGTPAGGEKLTTTGGVAAFKTLLQAGSYTITENPASKPGYVAVGSSGDCSFTVAYPANAGQTYTCTFTNALMAKANVVKVTDPVGGQAGWVMTLAGPGISETQTTDSGGNASFNSYLPAGSYTITETAQPGYAQTGAVGCSFTVAYPANAGQTFTCTLTNTKQATANLVKTVNGVVPPSPFSFTLKPASTNGGSYTTDVNGKIDFGYLVPGTTYTLCELNLPAGWSLTGTINGAPIAFTNPNASDNPPQDLGTRCFDFTPTPGQNLTVLINNTHPLGTARTIGYWKNWSTLGGGNQVQTALKNGGADAGYFILDNFILNTPYTWLPYVTANIKIGLLEISTTQIGVAILSKQDVKTGKQMSSDAAYGLAAQFLAAKLNYAANAGQCAIVTQAMTDAQNLLSGVGTYSVSFYGTGSYLPSSVKNNALTTRNMALSLASTFDQYNNNVLPGCP